MYGMYLISPRIVHQGCSSFAYTALRSLSAQTNLCKVKIAQGDLQGKNVESPSGKVFHSFQGIPYAKPPVGNLRFKPPQTAESWKGVRDATSEGNVSPHKNLVSGEIIGDEDCLFLNVYTPKLQSDKPLPVMVFIHGGAYALGSGNSDFYGSHYLVEEDVLVVTLNYRLGALGFITLDTPEVPGNAGLRDQVEALRWVQRNISQFGGDPDNVTLFGESAGAACVHFLTLSPMGQGLFKRVIMQSGNALMEWSYNRLGVVRSHMLGEFLGCKSKDPKELLDILQKAKVRDLVLSTLKTNTPDEKRRGLPIPYAPTVEKVFPGVEICLPNNPVDILKSGNFIKVPAIIGYNDSEGMAMIKDSKRKLDIIDTDFERMIPKFLNVEQHTEGSKIVADDIKRFYFSDKNVNKDTLPQLTDLLSDCYFCIGVHQMAHMHKDLVDVPPLYIYRFSFVGMLNLFKKMFGDETLPGACHGDEMFYLFKSGLFDFTPEENSDSYVVLKRMVKLWTNFAKTGYPTPNLDKYVTVKWDPVTKSAVNFLDIGKDLACNTNPDKQRADFWRNLYTKYNGDFIRPKLE